MAQGARQRDGMGRDEKKNIQKEGERGGGEEEDFVLLPSGPVHCDPPYFLTRFLT